jgi:hypothetical protein
VPPRLFHNHARTVAQIASPSSMPAPDCQIRSTEREQC